MDSLETLAKNNDAPSDTAIKEVNDILREPLQDLHDLDVEIQSLEERLKVLQTRRKEVRQRITPYQSILSPIRRLPEDMLSEIFQYCLPADRNPIMNANDCPLLLTRICSRWRAVAIADSRLWSRLYITFSDDDMCLGGLPADGGITDLGGPLLSSRVKQGLMHILRTRIEAVKEWVARSKSRPLSISLWLTCDHPRKDELQPNPYADQDLMLEFLQFLASISPRVQELNLLEISIEIYDFWESIISIPDMKMLKSFRADRYVTDHGNLDSPFNLLNAPNLQKIALYGQSFSFWNTIEASQSWSKLTHAVCHHTAFRASELAYFLERSPNLVVLEAEVRRDSLNDPPTPTPLQGQISLPSLRYLRICDGHRYPSIESTEVYNTIDAPSLECLLFSGSNRYHDYSSDDDPLPQLSLTPLLSRARGLKKLILDMENPQAWGLNSLFRAAATITHLIIGPARQPRLSDRSSKKSPPWGILTQSNTLWDVGGLLQAVNPPSVGPQTDGDSAPPPPLLPNLEYLSVSIYGVYFSDKALRDFIISRLDPSSAHAGSVAPLKHVGITCFREMEMDAEPAIRRHAESVGLDIDLDLEYHDPLLDPKMRAALCASYGLRRRSGSHTLPYDVVSQNLFYILTLTSATTKDLDDLQVDADGFLSTVWPSY